MRSRVWFGLLVMLVVTLALAACDSITNQGTINNLETRQAQLQGTISAMGTPALTIAALERSATQGFILQAEVNNVRSTSTAAELRALELQTTLTAIQGGGASVAAAPNSAPAPDAPNADQPPGVPTTAPTPDPGTVTTTFSQTVTAAERDPSTDCAAAPSAVFEATEDTIYVITRINYLPAGSVISARWLANGSLFFDDTQCWIPDEEWTDICAYCSIVPNGETFEAGTWTVDLLLDGKRLAQAQFQVTEPGAEATDNMQDEAAAQ